MSLPEEQNIILYEKAVKKVAIQIYSLNNGGAGDVPHEARYAAAEALLAILVSQFDSTLEKITEDVTSAIEHMDPDIIRKLDLDNRPKWGAHA